MSWSAAQGKGANFLYTKNKAQEQTNLLGVKNNIRPENIILKHIALTQ